MTGVSTLGQALEQIERIKEQQSLFAALSLQITSGKKTQSFSGLGSEVLVSKRARADFASLDIYINNVKHANRRIELMSGAIEEFQAQSRNFLHVLVEFSQESDHQEGQNVTYDDPLTLNITETTIVGKTSAEADADFKSLRQMADNISEFMGEILNVRENDRYLLSGAEMLVQPFTNAGTLDSAISSLVSQWKAGGITTGNLISDLRDRTATGGNPDALTDTIVGFSPALSAGNAGDVFVRVNQNAEVNYTTLANDQAFRDVMVAISYFRNETLPPMVDTYIPPNTYPGVPDVEGAPGADAQEMKDNFFAVFNELTSMVSAAVDRMDQLSFNLQNVRARITEIKISYEEDKNILLETISDVEDADINEAAVRVNALQTQIQASYAVTAALQQYTLVNFLTGNG